MRANTTITTKQYINLYPGLHIENLTGDVFIVATAGADKIDNYSENRTNAAYATQTGKAETTLDITSHIVFNYEGTQRNSLSSSAATFGSSTGSTKSMCKTSCISATPASLAASIPPTRCWWIWTCCWMSGTARPLPTAASLSEPRLHEDHNAPGSMRFDNYARIDLPLLSLSALRAMIEGGNQRTLVSFEGSLHTYTNRTRNLFTVGDDCDTRTGFVGEENSGMLQRSDIEYT